MNFIEWLEDHLLTCPYNSILGIDCLGCGMQRAVVALLKGNIVESFYLYPALLPLISLFLLLVTHLVFKFKNGAFWLKIHFIFVVVMVLFGFVMKLV